ncbi:MAG: monofunctional biosynthetic peptidoglycan transglycosylase [Xanthomonadaceae bacterium]|nr:monofunctional biosynthetic peptidoglycan transglycosylase [Xanthomonadaceae bacterium]
MSAINGGDVSEAQVGPKPRRRWLRRLFWLAVFVLVFPIVQVMALRFIDPPFSSFMTIRQFQAWGSGDFGFRIAHDWRDLDQMSPNVPVALIAAEDQRFADHAGFDMQAIEKARDSNERGRRIRGGSTITQQTAKNLFLWSGAGWTRWLRKALETWYTFWMELFWPKTRILEMYANFAEFGDGVYGAQAAARTWFHKDASRLTATEAARLAAVLPNPKRYSVAKPGPYVQRRTRAIQRQMRYIGGAGALRDVEGEQ